MELEGEREGATFGTCKTTYKLLSIFTDLEPPQLVVTPNASIEVDAGTTVTYVCMGYGEDEPPNIIWEFEDQLLSNDTSSLVTIYESQVVENRLVFSQSILELDSVETENTGMYTCTANNSRGSNSSTFTLNVRPRSKTKIVTIVCFAIIICLSFLPVAPTIFVHPNVTDPFYEGDTVALACTATGRPYPTIQWYKNGALLTDESLTTIYNEEVEQNGLLFTTSILEVCNVSTDDRGTYSCVAKNPAGNDTSEFDIQVMLGWWKLYFRIFYHTVATSCLQDVPFQSLVYNTSIACM